MCVCVCPNPILNVHLATTVYTHLHLAYTHANTHIVQFAVTQTKITSSKSEPYGKSCFSNTVQELYRNNKYPVL